MMKNKIVGLLSCWMLLLAFGCMASPYHESMHDKRHCGKLDADSRYQETEQEIPMSNSKENIVTTVRMVVKEDQFALFNDLTTALIEGSRAEPGVIAFDCYRSDEFENVYFFYERFVNADAFYQHRQETHTRNWIGRLGEFLEDRPVVNNFSEIEM